MRCRHPWASIATTVILTLAFGCSDGSSADVASAEGSGREDSGVAIDGDAAADAGVLTIDDLTTGGVVEPWAEAEEAEDATDLTSCHDLTTVEGGPSAAGLVEERSVSFASESVGTPTSLSALARNQVLVYPSEGAATDAFSGIDEELFAACIAPSVTPGAADEIEVDDGPEYDSGDESASFSVDLDDFVFFEGNDNSHMSDLIVVRVDNVVLVFQFIYGGQFFEGFDTEDLQSQTVEGVTAAVENAI